MIEAPWLSAAAQRTTTCPGPPDALSESGGPGAPAATDEADSPRTVLFGP